MIFIKIGISLSLNSTEITSLPDQVCNAIRLAIFKGELKPGDRLIQEDIAASLSISRMPVREALRKAEAEGLIEIKPNKGAVVKSISTKDIADTYELRSILEKIAVKESAPQLTQADTIELESLVAKMKIASNEDYILLNMEFHRILMMYCANQKLMDIIKRLWEGVSPYTPYILQEQMKRSNDDHDKILKSLKEEKYIELDTIIEQHILSTGDLLIKYLHEKEVNDLT